MINFLQETLNILERKGKTPKDVLWVGNGYEKTTWEDFTEIADFTYDNGYGGNVIDGELVIVGDNWWLERGEYDGSEWWNFKQLPTCESDGYTKLLNVKDAWLDELDWEE